MNPTKIWLYQHAYRSELAPSTKPASGLIEIVETRMIVVPQIGVTTPNVEIVR